MSALLGKHQLPFTADINNTKGLKYLSVAEIAQKNGVADDLGGGVSCSMSGGDVKDCTEGWHSLLSVG